MRTARLKTGVIGSGLVAQVMHLPYLAELSGQFDVRALCDSSRHVVEHCGDRFGITRRFTDWRDLLSEDLDAVLVLTSGSHAEITVAAAQAGMHVLTEKPMCYSAAEGLEMVAAAERAGVTLMVGYPKRYDPAYRRVARELQRLDDLRFVRLTTMESPFHPYTGHYPLISGTDVPPALAAQWRADSAARVRAAIGDPGGLAVASYEGVLLDTMVHEFNLLRGLLGEPAAVTSVSLRESTVTVMLDFGGTDCVVAWLDLPGIARYEMEACFYDPAERIRLAFGSPFLRNSPTVVDIETGVTGAAASAVSREVVSYEEPFKLELIEFHRAVTGGTEPVTSGLDGLRDIALCQSVIACALSGKPVTGPTHLGAAEPGSSR
jgi:predicted dehydrogenase